jgi:hypothetical protein
MRRNQRFIDSLGLWAKNEKHLQGEYVSFGSLADILMLICHVRFTLESGHWFECSGMSAKCHKRT